MSNNYKESFDRWHDYDALLGDATVWIGTQSYDTENEETGTDYKMAEKAIKNLHILDKRIRPDGITIKMANLGGDVYHGFSIYDAIVTCQNHVRIIGYGPIMSMGSLIFQAADERILSPNSKMMVHAISTTLSGTIYEIMEQAREVQRLQDDMNKIYLKRIKKAKKTYNMNAFVNKIKNKDWNLTPEEAIEFGLCDKVLPSSI